jgi:branched-chain amino acid transport system substrate-binding protein
MKGILDSTGEAIMKPIISAFLAMIIALFGFGFRAMGQSIKVGVVTPLTGRYAAIGNELKHGYDIAVEKINAGGGIQLGSRRLPLELIVLDDESDATKTVARLETHAAQGVVAYLGGVGSDLHAAAATVAEKNRIPYLGVGFALESIHKQGYRYLFSPFWKSPQIARETYRFLNGSLAENQRPKKVALFLERTDWGQEIGGYWESFGKEAGYEVVVKGEYAPGSKDFSNLILQAKSAAAESVLGVPSPPDGMTLVKQMKELDFTPKFLVLLRGSDSPAWAKNLGAAGDYTILGTGWHAALKYPQVKDLNDTYMRKHNRLADPIVGPGYAVVQILADALIRAKAADRDALRQALAATNMTTVSGPVRFRADGTAEISGVFIQWQKGKQHLVWPKENATAAFAYPAAPFNQR